MSRYKVTVWLSTTSFYRDLTHVVQPNGGHFTHESTGDMLIWHIDESVDVSAANAQDHMACSLLTT